MLTENILLDTVSKITAFINAISRFDCVSEITSGHASVKATSIMGLFALDLSGPVRLDIKNADDKVLPDIEEAIRAYVV